MKKLFFMRFDGSGYLRCQRLDVGRLTDMTVTDRSTGATLPGHYHRGKHWVAGVPAAEYAIDIRNAAGARAGCHFGRRGERDQP